MESSIENSSTAVSPNLTPPPDIHLSRAVSAVDLNASLAEVNEQPDQICHQMHKDIGVSGPKSQINTKDTEALSPDGALTPPYPNLPDPPPPTPATAEDYSEAVPVNEPTQNDRVSVPSIDIVKEKTKKKKKKKKSAAQKKPPATGFEEFFAETPIGPDDYAEELDLYHQDRDFNDRMQDCIQRYRSSRKFDPVRSNVLSKYLAYGGIETGSKVFTGGLDQETIEKSTASEIAAMQATDYIRTGHNNSRFYNGSDDWVVDFEGVAKGFFSQRLSQKFPIESEEQLQGYCAVVKNFLNYILYHKVCPEYTADVLAAREITDLAAKELWLIEKLSAKIPGDYNLAASILFGGRYTNVWGYGSWDDENIHTYNSTSTIRQLNKAKAELIFTTVISISGGKKDQSEVKISDIFISKTEKKYLEVVDIQHPDIHTIEEYSQVKDSKGNPAGVKPLGIVKMKRWTRPDYEQEDCTDDESHEEDNEDQIESYLLEDEILQTIFPSMKLELCVKELNIGIKFIDSFIGLNCSFNTLLPNEKMLEFKEPVLTNRPPPTEDDPDAEEVHQNYLEEEI